MPIPSSIGDFSGAVFLSFGAYTQTRVYFDEVALVSFISNTFSIWFVVIAIVFQELYINSKRVY